MYSFIEAKEGNGTRGTIQFDPPPFSTVPFRSIGGLVLVDLWSGPPLGGEPQSDDCGSSLL